MNEKRTQEEKSEIGFIVDNVSSLFKYLFPANDVLLCKWEKASTSNKNNECKKIRTDFVIMANGLEVGCGEVKTANTSFYLLEEDRARMAETLKRQLHVRMMKSKKTKEFVSFGILFDGFKIELYTMTFEAEKTPPYQLYEAEKLTLPSSPETYVHFEETIEHLISFKTSIISSMPEETDILEPYIYHDYIHLLKPTMAIKN
ncbi:uncharacterized protein B0P05DRAFT_28991 [Gilbertella persicaria]|uniref:uncharacterized protein n=1 Tax=Gilbertella persicaria TaxID=101096 RepID=UPI00221FB1D1|nr:uncharacterized protein B0P05DRAFT_28991 [Gilbertella persicaria]KAI8085963.1 hypothetical protein B0P05DRAFT_28991 [Gilbertella persicaria]